jgi:hypothetical protein
MNDNIRTIMFTCAFQDGSFADCLFELKACGQLAADADINELRTAYNEYVKQFADI